MSTGLRARIQFGGTFDPVHAGHLAVARAARDLLQAPVWLMPAADPPHRPPPGASAAERVALLEAALAGEHDLFLDLRELARSGPSWSVLSLAELREELGPSQPIVWLIGADAFRGLPTWREWQRLFALAHFLVAARPGSPLDDGLPAALAAEVQARWATSPADLLATPAGRVLPLGQPLRAESATDLRADIAAGRPWRQDLPVVVADRILARGLYGAGGSYTAGESRETPAR
jgi:nicotinate-nucleotide adenylyltransferase